MGSIETLFTTFFNLFTGTVEAGSTAAGTAFETVTGSISDIVVGN